jgi:hypothetical protein
VSPLLRKRRASSASNSSGRATPRNKASRTTGGTRSYAGSTNSSRNNSPTPTRRTPAPVASELGVSPSQFPSSLHSIQFTNPSHIPSSIRSSEIGTQPSINFDFASQRKLSTASQNSARSVTPIGVRIWAEGRAGEWVPNDDELTELANSIIKMNKISREAFKNYIDKHKTNVSDAFTDALNRIRADIGENWDVADYIQHIYDDAHNMDEVHINEPESDEIEEYNMDDGAQRRLPTSHIQSWEVEDDGTNDWRESRAG